MSKVLVIGIDGMDVIQVSKFEKYMPNFSRLKQNSPDIKLKSVFPPDSIPAWGSIYTGLNPAEHGVVNFVDPTNDEFKIKFQEVHKSYEGRTFWDIASKKGKKVCILLPYAIYPPWPVNGAMVCRSLDVVNEDFPLKTYPEELFEEFNLNEINVNLFHGFPSKRNYPKFIESCKKRTLQESELGLRFLKNYDADLYFIYFSALDAIQHTFWNYCDEKHPDYPGENSYQNVIRDFYILMDDILGKFISLIDDDTRLIILSDHGHGMRPVNLVNINEILREKGYLKVNVKNSTKINPFRQKETIKKILAQTIGVIGVGNLGLKFVEKFPIIKKGLSTPNYINFDETTAYLSAISGLKSYSEGGILINKNLQKSDYNKIIEQIIKELSEVRHPETGENLMEWICKRENLFDGTCVLVYWSFRIRKNNSGKKV